MVGRGGTDLCKYQAKGDSRRNHKDTGAVKWVSAISAAKVGVATTAATLGKSGARVILALLAISNTSELA